MTRAEWNFRRQQPQREREHHSRLEAVRFVTAHQTSCRRAAAWLHIAPRTLTAWQRHHVQGSLTAKPRGRPCREPTTQQRAEVAAILAETGPRLGLPILQASCPDTPRCVLHDLLRDHRRQFQAEHRVVTETLHWHRAGAVWAIDHSEPPRRIDGWSTQILAVRDLASGLQLAWMPVADATASEALRVLEDLVLRHGPPLVLKSDNGAAFKAHDYADWLQRWRIIPLFSPVRMPRYNGACEAGIGAAKSRTEYLAARHGRHLAWSANDLYAAQVWANEESYPDGYAAGTPAARFAVRMPLDVNERDTFEAAVLQCEQEFNRAACTAGESQTDMLKAIHHRRAVRQALVELGYLDITRRLIPQQLPAPKRARIT